MNIVEFAKHLNLSIGTVSRALNDRPEVSESTRRLVLDKAEELGFSRNASARRLVSGRSYLIQLECPYNTHILSDRYLVEMARALEEAAGAQGYDLLLHLGTSYRSAEEVNAVDALVVMAGADTSPSDIRKLSSAGRTPTVVIMDANQPDYQHVSSIRIDSLSGVREAFVMLASFGHCRVGYIGSGQPSFLSHAVPALLSEAGFSTDPSLFIDAGITPEEGSRAANKLLTSANPPTAIFARTDILAASAIQAAHDLGLSVPGDVSVIGHDNIEIAAVVSPPLTTVAVDITTVASAAMDAVMAMVLDKADLHSHVLGTHLVVRESVGPRKL